MSNAYGFSVPDRKAPDMTIEVRREIESVIVDAAAGVSTEATHEEMAQQTFRAIEDAVKGWSGQSNISEGQRGDLLAIPSSTKVSRAAVTASPVDDVPGVVRSCVIDNLRTWHLIGDWKDRDRCAAEMVVRLHEEGANFDPERNYADKMLLGRAREEQARAGRREALAP